jgi:DNA repair protein RadC
LFSISDREVKKINEREVMKNIKDMPKHARPREKLREKGASALTDEELLAAILGMGTAGLTCARLPGRLPV